MEPARRYEAGGLAQRPTCCGGNRAQFGKIVRREVRIGDEAVAQPATRLLQPRRAAESR